MRRGLLILLLLIVIILGVFAWSFFGNPRNNPLLGQRKQPEGPGLTNKTIQSEQAIAPVPTVTPRLRATPAPVVVSHPSASPLAEQRLEPASIRVYTGEGKKEPEQVATEEMGDYAPYGRLVRCQLINTVDSASIETPIIGLVENDVWWDGKIIIHKCSEVHAIAQIDKSRERIASEGAFTFILHDPDDPGFGRELVVKGIALDREDDPSFLTYGITDGSSGLRGMVIKTDKMAEVKLFVASLISGVSQGLAATTTDAFGNVVNNPNGRGVANLPGTVINPVVGGAQAVLDRYAQLIEDAIERDGFFVRVPAGKQFYVYVRQAIDLNKATIAGDPARKRIEQEWLDDRVLLEKVTQPRTQRDQKVPNNRVGSLYDQQLNSLSQGLQRTSEALQQQTKILQEKANEVSGQNPQVPSQ